MGEKRLVITGFDEALEDELREIALDYGHKTLSGFIKMILKDFVRTQKKKVDKKRYNFLS